MKVFVLIVIGLVMLSSLETGGQPIQMPGHSDGVDTQEPWCQWYWNIGVPVNKRFLKSIYCQALVQVQVK